MTPESSRRLALGLSAIVFLVIYPLLNGLAWRSLPTFASSKGGGDFSQYYSAALAAKVGIREHLYPIPNQDLYSRPPTFRPVVASFLFDRSADESRSGRWAFYPQIASPEASDVSLALSSNHPALQYNFHYISPPPLAWLLFPLAFFEYETAKNWIWFSMMSASLFGISFYSAQIARLIYRRPTYVETLAALLPLVPVLLCSPQGTTLAAGNVSPLLGFLITFAAYSFVTNRQILLGFSVIPLILFKGFGVIWCPLFLIGGIRWRVILTMLLLTVFLNSLTLYHGGISIYETFFQEILPRGSIPLPYSVGIRGILMNLLGVDAGLLFSFIGAVLLLALYGYYYRALRGGHNPEHASLAVLIGSLAVFNLFNTIVWPNYITLFLVLPFSAWITFEISLRRGLPRILMTLIFLSIGLTWMDSVFVGSESLLVGWLESKNLYSHELVLLRKSLNLLSLYVIPNAISATVLVIALRRLAAPEFAGIADSPEPSQRESYVSPHPSQILEA